MRNYLIVFGITAGILVIGIIIGLKLADKPSVGSVGVTSEYQATTTSPGRFPSAYLLLTGGGTLGSVVVTGPASGSISLYDATTSDVNLRTGQKATSSLLIADFPMGTATSTYTFDSVFFNGLYIQTNGTMPTSTITFRR